MLDALLEDCLGKCLEYCSKKENMEMLQQKVLGPILKHISERFYWLTYTFQTLVVLVLVQTALTVFLLFKR